MNKNTNTPNLEIETAAETGTTLEVVYSINRTAPLSRIAAKVRDELNSPVTVIAFGPGSLATEIVLNLCQLIGDRQYDYGPLNSFEQLESYKGYCGGATKRVHVLDATNEPICGTTEDRRQIVQTLRDAGVETVVGFYIDIPDSHRPNDWLKDIPCSEEFDYLIIADGKNLSHTLPRRQD